MEYPIIFSKEEQRDRYLLNKFLQTYFTPCKETQTPFDGNLQPEVILSIYQTIKEETVLNAEIVTHLLTYGGFVNERNQLLLSIKEDTFKYLSPKTQDKILQYCNNAKALPYRQLILGSQVQAVDNSAIFYPSIQRFIKLQIFDKSFKFLPAVPKGLRNTSHVAVYQWYQTWCKTFNYMPEPKNLLINTLKQIGFKSYKGYYNGTSGTSVLLNCIIPHTEEEQQMSLQEFNGLGVKILNDYVVFNDGRILTDFSDDGLKAYVNKRTEVKINEEKSRSAEERPEEREKEIILEADSSIGRKQIEILEETIGSRTRGISKTGKRNSIIPDPEGCIQNNQIDKVARSKPLTRCPQDGDERTSAANKTALGTTDVTSIDTSRAGGADAAEHATSFGGLSETERSSIEGNKEEPELIGISEKKTLFTGLRVLYRLTPPGTFTLETFKEELSRAGLGIIVADEKRALQVQLLYDEFINSIKR